MYISSSTKSTIISILFISIIIYFSRKYTKINVDTPWYNCIKPNITPPNYIFPIVWTILYVLLFIIFKKIIDSKNISLIIIFIINLLLNILWTYMYFYKKNIENAFNIILLICLSSFIILYKISKISDKILYTPYTLWICFATYLNYLSLNKINACIM